MKSLKSFALIISMIGLVACSSQEKEVIHTAIENGDLSKLSVIQEIIEITGAIQYTTNRAQEAADKAVAAIKSIPESKYKKALISIAISSLNRQT